MLRLTLIGGTSANKIQEVINKRFDNVETTIFSTIPDFCEASEVRSMVVDRLFILQDAFDGVPREELITSFNDYLGVHYPSTRVITLCTNEDLLNLFSRIFISPTMVHIKAKGIKVSVIDDLVEKSPEELQEKYGYISNFSFNDTIDEMVDSTTNEEESEETPAQTKDNKGKKKSKGFFSIFGKRNKQTKKTGKKGKKESDLPSIPSGVPPLDTSAVGGSVPNPESFDDVGGSFSGNYDDTELPSFAKERNSDMDVTDDITDFPSQGESTTLHTNLEQEQSSGTSVTDTYADVSDDKDIDDIDFTMLDGDVNVGTLNRGTSHGVDEVEDFDFSPSSNEETLVDSVTSDEDFDVSLDNVSENLDSLDDDLGLDEFEQEREQFLQELKVEAGLKLDDEVDIPSDNTKEPDFIVPDIEQQLRKFDTVKQDVLSKKIDTSITEVGVPNLHSGDFEIEDVTADVPIFTDLEELEKQYNDENIKVIEVERVVERVVEKPIPATSIKANKKVYPTGVRILVFTGDRKSGVTKTALQSAMFYGKTEKTLFVDFDIQRKGSLLYYGIDNIILENENVQNGLFKLKTPNMLKYVTYNFFKGGFDCLISLYNEPYQESDLVLAQRILSTQREYTTIVIDCPLENLHYLEDILLYSEIIVCVESDLQSVLNTIMGLAGVFEENSKLGVFLYNNAKYLLTRNPDPEKFRENLDYVAYYFSLDKEETDWSSTPILGTSRDLAKILNHI